MAGRDASGTARRKAVLTALTIAGLLFALIASAAALADRAPATANTSSTKQECLSELLQPPHVTQAVMLNPHKTEILVKGQYGDVEGCDSGRRVGRYRVQLKQSGHWKNLGGNFWYPTDENENPEHKFAFLDFATRSVHEHCVKGHWEPARVQFRNEVRNVATGKITAQGKIKDHRVKIEPDANC